MKAVKVLLMVLFAGLTACSTQKITTTSYTPLLQADSPVAESELLDVGVIPLDPGLDKAGDEEQLLPELRNAEGRFLASKISATVQRSASWGAVRVIPSKENITDVYVEGTIIKSDGEQLKLEVSVSDSTGRQWYTKEYTEVVGKYAYDYGNKRDPFQGLFNRIANDLVAYQGSLANGEAEKLRTISEIRFAERFSPEAFSGYLNNDKDQPISLTGLPAPNDPLLQRIKRIRERDYLFIDTLQEHYNTFSKRMERPYHQWRENSYDEILAIRKLKRQSTTRTLAGIGAILVGIAAAGGSNGSAQAAGAVGIAAGGYLIKDGLGKRADAQLHIDTLLEMGASLEAEIEPQVIELEDRTITLTGNVEAQYEQWKDILKQIYEQDRGSL